MKEYLIECIDRTFDDEDYYKINKYIEDLEEENKQLKEDIKFCLHSIKQEMEMSTDSRTRKEMASCYEILRGESDEKYTNEI